MPAQDRARAARPSGEPGPIAPGFKHEEVHAELTAKAVEFIRQASQPRSRFSSTSRLTAPHMPWLPSKEFQGKSKAGPYGDFVMHVDDTLGRVMKALDDAKLADNTLVIFTSDNGAYWTPEDIASGSTTPTAIGAGKRGTSGKGAIASRSSPAGRGRSRPAA